MDDICTTEQAQRDAALRTASAVLRSSYDQTMRIKPSSAGRIDDLIRIASWIIEGYPQRIVGELVDLGGDNHISLTVPAGVTKVNINGKLNDAETQTINIGKPDPVEVAQEFSDNPQGDGLPVPMINRKNQGNGPHGENF